MPYFQRFTQRNYNYNPITTMSLYRIAGTITFILIGLSSFGLAIIPGWFTGIFAILAAIGLGAGV